LSTPATHPPDPRELRRFGLVMAAMIGGLFGALVPLLKGAPVRTWPWAVALLFAAAALGAPRALGPVHQVWMRIGHALGWVNTRILLTVVFYTIITPTGLVMRALGRNPLRGPRDTAASHRRPSRAPAPEGMERPF
jgi:hypothetical protein